MLRVNRLTISCWKGNNYKRKKERNRNKFKNKFKILPFPPTVKITTLLHPSPKVTAQPTPNHTHPLVPRPPPPVSPTSPPHSAFHPPPQPLSNKAGGDFDGCAKQEWGVFVGHVKVSVAGVFVGCTLGGSWG